MILNELEKQVGSSDRKCSDNDNDCWSTVQRIMRSIGTLSGIASRPPKSAGHYIAYHWSKLFEDNSFLQQTETWPYLFFMKPENFLFGLGINFLNNFFKFNKITEPIKKVILQDINKLDFLKSLSLRVSNKGIF